MSAPDIVVLTRRKLKSGGHTKWIVAAEFDGHFMLNDKHNLERAISYRQDIVDSEWDDENQEFKIFREVE